MEKYRSYEQLITEGIKGLPPELLAEIADFVYFVRKRFMYPQTFETEREIPLLEPSPEKGEPVTPADESGQDWLKLAGTISLDDLHLMSEAIEAGCEQVDLNEW